MSYQNQMLKQLANGRYTKKTYLDFAKKNADKDKVRDSNKVATESYLDDQTPRSPGGTFTSQTLGRSITKPMSQQVSQPMSHQIKQPVKQQMSQPMSPQVNQPIRQPMHRTKTINEVFTEINNKPLTDSKFTIEINDDFLSSSKKPNIDNKNITETITSVKLIDKKITETTKPVDKKTPTEKIIKNSDRKPCEESDGEASEESNRGSQHEGLDGASNAGSNETTPEKIIEKDKTSPCSETGRLSSTDMPRTLPSIDETRILAIEKKLIDLENYLVDIAIEIDNLATAQKKILNIVTNLSTETNKKRKRASK